MRVGRCRSEPNTALLGGFSGRGAKQRAVWFACYWIPRALDGLFASPLRQSVDGKACALELSEWRLRRRMIRLRTMRWKYLKCCAAILSPGGSLFRAKFHQGRTDAACILKDADASSGAPYSPRGRARLVSRSERVRSGKNWIRPFRPCSVNVRGLRMRGDRRRWPRQAKAETNRKFPHSKFLLSL